MKTKRSLTLLLALVMTLSVLTVCVPSAHAAIRNLSGSYNVSSFQNGDEIYLSGDLTLTIDATRTLGFITDSNSKYTLTIKGDDTHTLKISSDYHSEAMVGNKLVLQNRAIVEAAGVDRGINYATVEIKGGSQLKATGATEYGIRASSTFSCESSIVNAVGATDGITCGVFECREGSILTAGGLGAGGDGIHATTRATIYRSSPGHENTVNVKGGAYAIRSDGRLLLYPGSLTAEGGTAALRCGAGSIERFGTVDIFVPRGGSFALYGNYGTVCDANGKLAKLVRLGVAQTLTGTVGCSKSEYVYGDYIFLNYTGAAASIPDEDRIITWQRSPDGNTVWIDLPDEGLSGHAHQCGVDDLFQFLRPKMEAVGYTGTLYGSPVYVKKGTWPITPATPALTFDNVSITVTNADPRCEYVVTTRKPTASEIAAPNFWSNAVKAVTDTLTLGCTYGRTNYVYCRFAEDAAYYAGTEYSYASVSCDRIYDLWVGGTKVKDSNCEDPLDNGVFSYDPDTNVLTVKGTYSCSDTVILSLVPGLKVTVAASGAKLTSTAGNAILTYTDMTVTGPGKLQLASPDYAAVGVTGGSTLSLIDADVEITSQRVCLCGNLQSPYTTNTEKLLISNSRVKATGTNGAVYGFAGGITLNKSYILFPHPNSFQNGNSSIRYNNGNAATYVEIRPQPFVDIKTSEYWFFPIMWAYERDPQITNGSDATHFSPKKDCTRAQVVTFLWRANGCPEPTSTDCPFTDVKPTAFYYKAMLWAVENGITSGTSSTTFGPDKACTRAQVVTFLWRAKGSPMPSDPHCPFTDVKSGSAYYNAILWAVENGITSGTSPTTFSPSNTCNRGQVVTFLYRVYGPKG